MTEESLEERGLEARHEPAFNAPWPVLVTVAAIIGLYALQSLSGGDGPIRAYGFTPSALTEGRWTGLFTALFVHGGWPHALLNSLGALAFGAPVARLFGLGGKGAIAYFAFYLIAGALANLGFALVHPGSPALLVGASGAVSAMMGAASRLVDRKRFADGPVLAPFGSRTVVAMAVSWVVINVIIGFIGLGDLSGDAPVAWEAHIAGYAVGLFAIGPVARLLGRT